MELTELTVYNNGITNRGARAISENQKRLTELNILSNDIAEDYILNIAKNLKNLQVFRFTAHNPKSNLESQVRQMMPMGVNVNDHDEFRAITS